MIPPPPEPPAMKKGTPKFLEMKDGTSKPSGMKEGTPQSPGVKEGTPQSPAVKEGTPQSPGVKEDIPQSLGVKEGTPRSPGVKEGTPQSPGVKEGTPQSPGVKEGTPQSPGVKEGTPQSPGVKEGTPQSPGVKVSTPLSPSGYTLQDVNFGRLYKAATQTSKRVLKAVFLVVMRRARVAVVDPWPASVAEYCQRVLGWGNTKLRQNFNSEERSLLQQPVEAADMDVSLLSKLMHKLFEDLSVPETLWRALRDVKNMRNRVCHEHLVLDDQELTQTLSDLKAIYDVVLDEVGEVFGVQLEDVRRAVCAEVDEIMSSAVMVEASEYFGKVEQFRIELVGRFISQGQRELMDRYSKLQVLNPFTWLSSDRFPQLQVRRIFTPLLIMEQNRKVEDSALLASEMLDPETGEDSGTLPDVVVLSGIAGCGKTSLCRFLLHDWRTHGGAVASLRSVDILLHIEAKNVTSCSLITFLQKILLPDTCSHFEEKDVLQVLRQVSVLYVIDGMDEATADAKMLVRDVFSQASGSRIVVTTRPEYTSDVTQLAEQHHLSHMKLTVHGFSDEGRRSFVSRVLTAFVPDEAQRRPQEIELLKFLRTSCSGLAGHLKLPLTLALLVCLWQDDRTRIAKVTSATKLYSEIFRLCTTKMATRLQGSSASHPLDLQTFVETWLLALGRGAYRMLEESRLVIDEETQKELTALCEARGVASLQVFSAFLQCEVQAGLLGMNHHFAFVHKSQMEYLAALYLTNEVITTCRSSNTSVRSTLEELKIFRRSLKKESRRDIHDIILFSGWGAKWVNTWLFVVGHLCMKKAANTVLEAVLEAIVSVPAVTHNEGTMWRLVEESGRHPLVREKVGAAMTKDYFWKPREEDLCDAAHPVAMLMQHTPFTPRSVLLRVVGSVCGSQLLKEGDLVHSATYDGLTSVLTTVSRRPECQVYLKLDRLYYTWGGEETADHLLKLLQPSGNLVCFIGHLGPSGAAALASRKEMSELRVRVTSTEALQKLARGVLSRSNQVLRLTLRLDLPWASLTAPLPRVRAALIDIIFRGVEDATAAAAAKVMVELSRTFFQVDLVASRLTSEGATTFLQALRAAKVTVKDCLVVRSPHRLQQEARAALQELTGGAAFQWWC
ncbi:uncharacterized protein LOC135094806 [Scylla paramamosain]|uniref:uncharacterized protein LOC135094806 n=1 Tax=Scylla paramamosain TaxID=85552 RepID=UPI00308331C1